MIGYRSRSIFANNSEKEIESCQYDSLTSAQVKVTLIIEDNVGKRSFIDVSKPGILIIVSAEDPDKEMLVRTFEGPEIEMKSLQLFALRCKVEAKRRENLSLN